MNLTQRRKGAKRMMLMALPLALLVVLWPVAQAKKQRSKDMALLHEVCEAKPNVAMMRYLIEKGANPNAKEYSFPLLNLAVRSKRFSYEDLSGVVFLLDHGADPNAIDPNGETPLMLAAMNRDVRIVRLLIKKGADVNLTNKTLTIFDYVDRLSDRRSPEREQVIHLLDAAGAQE